MSSLASARVRRLVFAGLYFAKGAPSGCEWWTQPVTLVCAWLRKLRAGLPRPASTRSPA